MAVTDQQFQQLLNSLNDLTRTIKQDKNSFQLGSQGSGTRMSRGGSANGRSIREDNQTVQSLATNLEELHKSFKSGGRTIADHFKEMVKNINPLNAAFGKLEDAVTDAAATQTKAYNLAAKHTLDYVKKVSGNVDKLKDLNNDYADLASSVADIVENQEEYAKNQALLNSKLKKAHDARIKIEKSGIHGSNPVLTGPLSLFLKNLEKNPNAKLSHNAQYGANQLQDQFKAVNDLTKKFFKDMAETTKKATEDFQRSIESSLKALGSAIAKDAEKIPSYISTRLKYGFESNQFLDAFRMGLSAEELNQMRAANRDVINGVTGFGRIMEKDATESLRVWSDNAKQVGLIGQEASQFTSDWMRNAFQTGRTYNNELNRELTNQAQTIQQIFGGSIQESAKLIQDYSTQVYNIAKFNKAQTAEQQAALQNELKVRLLHTKYMGIDVEYMKQQQQARYNSAFSDIGDRIRSAILGQVAVNSVKSQAGLTDEEARVYSLGASNSGYQLNEQEERTYQAALVKMSKYDQARINATNEATRTGGIGGLASVGLEDVVYQRLAAQSGINRREATEQGQRAIAQQRARGDISFDDYIKFAEENQKKQADSVTMFDKAVMEFSESVAGFKGLPGAALAGALGGAAVNIGMSLLKRRIAGSALETIAGRGGAGLLGRLGLGGLGGFGAGATGAAGGTAAAGAGGLTLGGLATGAAGVAGAGLAGWGIGTGLSKWGQDAYHSDNKAYKAVSQVLNPLGYGATAISNYFSDRNSDSWTGISERVAKTGQYSKEDIDEFIRMREVGDWWVTDEERARNRQAAIQQLDQIASYTRRKQANSVAADRPRSNAVSTGIDLTNGLQRDANGNPIPANQVNPINELVEIQREALDVAKDTKKDANERAEREQVIEDQRTKAQQQIDFVTNATMKMF